MTHYPFHSLRSIAVPSLTRTLQVSHVCSIRSRASVRVNSTAFDWYVLFVLLCSQPSNESILPNSVGVLADNSTSRYGRRRPYMLLGSLLCAVAMLILGFTPSVAGWLSTPGTSFHGTLTIWFAVLSIYIIDFSINAVQAADRALLVDTLPSSQQERGNAWAGRMLSFGSVIGFWVGNWDLPALMPWFGRTQLQVLCVLTSLGLLAAHALTCVAVKERVLVAGSSRVDSGARRKRGVVSALKDIWENVWKLPRVVQQIVCPLSSHSFCPLTIFRLTCSAWSNSSLG